VQFELVWQGVLRHSVRLDAGTASLEIGRLLRTLPTPDEHLDDAAALDAGSESDRGDGWTPGIAVRQEELDLLLAVRQWVRDAPPASVIPFPAHHDHGRRFDHGRSLEVWRQRLVDSARRLLDS
jgi:hypothetical protein